MHESKQRIRERFSEVWIKNELYDERGVRGGNPVRESGGRERAREKRVEVRRESASEGIEVRSLPIETREKAIERTEKG